MLEAPARRSIDLKLPDSFFSPDAGPRDRGLPGQRPGLTPNALLHNLKHNKVLHEAEPVRHRATPRGAVDADDKRVRGRRLDSDCGRCPDFGLRDEPDVPCRSRLQRGRGGPPVEDMETSYFCRATS